MGVAKNETKPELASVDEGPMPGEADISVSFTVDRRKRKRQRKPVKTNGPVRPVWLSVWTVGPGQHPLPDTGPYREQDGDKKLAARRRNNR